MNPLLQERLAAEEWGAVAMSMVGTAGLGFSSENVPQAEAELGIGRTLVVAIFLTALVAGLLYASRLASLQMRKSVAGARTAASVNGLQVWLPENCF